jgi:hypothetical protein
MTAAKELWFSKEVAPDPGEENGLAVGALKPTENHRLSLPETISDGIHGEAAKDRPAEDRTQSVDRPMNR